MSGIATSLPAALPQRRTFRGRWPIAATQLVAKQVEKIWGRRDLPGMFGGAYVGREPLGEVWFEDPNSEDSDLLVKYLFTSEKLSIQVHPGDEAAIGGGYSRGKDEAWIILKAEPGATIGVGLRERVSKAQLRQAALDGSIEDLVDWRPAAAGDILYSPAGTIHALGPGLTLIEVQQNVDVTYRLYDYGRDRELQLEEGIKASNPAPYTNPMSSYVRTDGREILAKGRAFVLERWSQPLAGLLRATEDRPIWLVPVSGSTAVSSKPMKPGTVWMADGNVPIALSQAAELFIAYPGAEVRDDLIG
jgi:mannose-6-phosphate isomerase